MQFCVFDTETTGLPTPVETPDGIKLVYPRLVQLAWVILDQNQSIYLILVDAVAKIFLLFSTNMTHHDV